MSTITITVEAPIGGGKSTVARVIRDALNAAGIKASLIGLEPGEFASEAEAALHQAERVALVAAKSTVEIQTRTLKRVFKVPSLDPDAVATAPIPLSSSTAQRQTRVFRWWHERRHTIACQGYTAGVRDKGSMEQFKQNVVAFIEAESKGWMEAADRAQGTMSTVLRGKACAVFDIAKQVAAMPR